jgi:hypothetical protein
MKQLDDFIKVYDDVLSEQSCEIILTRFRRSDIWSDDSINFNDRHIREAHQDIDELLFRAITKTARLYRQDVQDVAFRRDAGYELIRLKDSDMYTKLNIYNERSELSCIISLNDDYWGGEHEFLDCERRYKLSAGSILVYPSNFIYQHKISPVEKGTSYIVTTVLL